MELRDVEICLGIQFPELFHTINNSGMMDYLRHSSVSLQVTRQYVPKVLETKAYSVIIV